MSEPIASATGANHDAPSTLPMPKTLRGGWSDVEEARLIKAVLSLNLRSGRTTGEQWGQVADLLAEDGKALGFPRRTGSACRHRAVKLEVYRPDREEPPVRIPAQSSFAPLEVKLVLAEALEKVAKELRGA